MVGAAGWPKLPTLAGTRWRGHHVPGVRTSYGGAAAAREEVCLWVGWAGRAPVDRGTGRGRRRGA